LYRSSLIIISQIFCNWIHRYQHTLCAKREDSVGSREAPPPKGRAADLELSSVLDWDFDFFPILRSGSRIGDIKGDVELISIDFFFCLSGLGAGSCLSHDMYRVGVNIKSKRDNWDNWLNG
jgi:hypothetical protein